ncbi:hypothetical protein E5329_03595 [Petralouisia muris]|uniref:Uncharacterized protein n=1 Tax=Petralouisia muris TaxID=3032872 RepID=A0AC61S014_9FIRM|nr:Hint domain-containing protein [Petralouisia muris]TGY97699.1 hypothetical protein E5329_03595 [Petralouisia muris]
MEQKAVEMDFYKENYADEFFEDFGGAEAAKLKYPLVYAAVQKTHQWEKEAALRGKRQNEKTNGDDMEEKGFVLGAIYPTTAGKTDAFLEGRMTEAEPTDHVIACDALGTVKEAVQIGVTMELMDLTLGSLLDVTSSCVETTDIKGSIACLTKEIGLYNDHNLQADSAFYYLYPNGVCGKAKMKATNYALINGNSMVSEFVVDDPKIMADHTSNKHVTIVYDREPKNQEKADYSYKKDEIEIQGDLVRTIIPVNGSIHLAKNLEPKGLSSVIGLLLIYNEETVVSYHYQNIGELNNYLTPEKQSDGTYKLKFAFDKDWGAYLKKTRYNDGTYITDCQLRWSFRYDCYRLGNDGKRLKDENGDEVIFELGFCINSEASAPSGGQYNKSGGNKVVIPYLFIQWGCFGRDTKIKMADGTQKPVSEIEPGESVMDDKGNSAVVREVYTGQEESLFQIQTESGKILELTAGHPVLTEIGMVKACNLAPGAALCTEEGREEIAEINEKEYHGTVYSLDCGGAHLIANGLTAGDFVCQNEGKKKKTPEISEEMRALMDEMKRMLKDFASSANAV